MTRNSWEPYKEFWAWISDKRNLSKGLNASGQPTPYIPHDRLCRYWTLERVTAVIKVYHELPENLDTLYGENTFRVRYIRIFSILVMIRKVGYLQEFISKAVGDCDLPLNPRDSTVFQATQEGIQDAWSFFYAQFQFCPVQLGSLAAHDQVLENGCILPLTVDRVLAEGDGKKPRVTRCRVHRTTAEIPRNTIVIKEYPSLSITEYRNEVRMYSLMRQLQKQMPIDTTGPDLISRYFVSYHGSYQLCGKGYIFLEDADESLEDMYAMRRDRLYEWGIHDREQLVEVWEAVTPLLRALETWHGLNVEEHGGPAVHLSVTPANVFLYEVCGGDDIAESKLKFKLRWRLASGERGLSRHYGKSERMYEAPEISQLFEKPTSKAAPAVYPVADVWSLGCVLLELLVWTVCGEQGRRDFLEDRQDEHLAIYDTQEEDASERQPSGQFHLEGGRSKSVERILDKVLSRRRVFDDVTEHVGEFILENMLLVNPDDRKSAGELADMFEDMWVEIIGKSAREYEQELVMWEERKGLSFYSSSSYATSSEDITDSSEEEL